MSAHKYAKLMALYAQDAAETETAWKRWEMMCKEGGVWFPCETHPRWSTSVEYRRKPQTSRERFDRFQAEVHQVDPFDLTWIREEERYKIRHIQKRWESWQEAERQARENSDE